MTGPREWRHAEGCSEWEEYESLDLLGNINYTPGECTCGLSAVRDAIATGHRVVIGPDGVEGRLVEMGAYERRGTYSDQAFRVEEP